jgi:NADPH-dependent 2,4-dienoyl-CoA reductase/sulfur reductase-like enzyme
MTDRRAPVIVGAGPAGVRAAQTLVAHGLRPVLVDEAPRAGGQIYRQPPPGFTRSKRTLYGTEAGRADAIHRTMAALQAQVDHRPETLVWSAEGRTLHLLRGERASQLQHDGLIVATGATDRVLPFPGWTLPGVYTLGAAQVALKYQGCAIGARVVLAGTGPLLYLVAWQYAHAGADVAAVLDSATLGDQVAALPGLLRDPITLAKGLRLRAGLLRRGVPVHQGVRVLHASADQGVRVLQAIGALDAPASAGQRVAAITWHDGQREHQLACDAICFGHTLRSETQLADLLGCDFAFDALQRAHLPLRDAAGRSSVPGVYLAGDGAGVRGADAAEAAGERAALALLADRGVAVDAARADQLERQLARSTRLRESLEQAFPFPEAWAAQAPDELLLCRCEEITVGQLRQTARECGADELNRAKALCRVGMGRCQGRYCGAAAAEVLAQAVGVPIAQVGRLRAQAPIKPIPMALALPDEAA